MSAISRWIALSEQVFLDVGGKLADLHERVSRVRSGIGRSIELQAVEGDDGTSLHLTETMADAQRLNTLSQKRGEVLASLNAVVLEGAEASDKVRSIFRTLNYVALIARVQVERMGGGQDDLVPFAIHVNELVTSGAGIAGSVGRRIENLNALLDTIRTLDERASASAIGAELAQDFSRLASLVAEQQGSAVTHRKDAQRSFTELWRAIAGVVMGVQAHDMARQRFEHTARNLTIMGRLTQTGDPGDGGDPIPIHRRMAMARRVAILETAQLADLAEIYGAKMRNIDTDLARIGNELEACDGLLERLVASEAPSALSHLNEEALRLRSGFGRGRSVRKRMIDSVQDSVEATKTLIDLTDKLVELEYNLHLAGFNAAVRAANVAGGDETIGYIARTIREQATNARLQADRVRSGIEQAFDLTEILSAEILPGLNSVEMTIEAALEAAATRLRQADVACREALTQSAEAAHGLSADAAKVRSLMSVHEDGVLMINALSAALAACLSGWPDDVLSDEEAERIDRLLTAPYTMEEERAVYARTFRTALPPSPNISEANGDLDDFLF